MTRWSSRQDAASAHENLITDNKDTLPFSLIRAFVSVCTCVCVCVLPWQQEIGSSVCPRSLTDCGYWHSAFAGGTKGPNGEPGNCSDRNTPSTCDRPRGYLLGWAAVKSAKRLICIGREGKRRLTGRYGKQTVLVRYKHTHTHKKTGN